MTSSEDEGMLSAGSGNLCPEHGSSAVHSPPTLLFPWLVPSTCSFWDHAMFMSAFSLPGCRLHNEPFTLLIPRPWLNELSLKTAWVVCVRSCPLSWSGHRWGQDPTFPAIGLALTISFLIISTEYPGVLWGSDAACLINTDHSMSRASRSTFCHSPKSDS